MHILLFLKNIWSARICPSILVTHPTCFASSFSTIMATSDPYVCIPFDFALEKHLYFEEFLKAKFWLLLLSFVSLNPSMSMFLFCISIIILFWSNSLLTPLTLCVAIDIISFFKFLCFPFLLFRVLVIVKFLSWLLLWF